MKICFFTGTRAEYGLLRPLMQRVADADAAELRLIVSGAHLSNRHGRTLDEIEHDGFQPDATVALCEEIETEHWLANAIGTGIERFANALADIAPDALVLLGDRYEAFSCATAAAVSKIPMAHIHGGETTEGAMDEFFRHAITKMSQLHFVSCETHRKRVIQLGESPGRVFNVGALGVENIQTMALMTRQQLEEDLQFQLGPRFILATYHPVTLADDGVRQTVEFFAALQLLVEQEPDLKVVLTGANADPGGRRIDEMAASLKNQSPQRVLVRQSLGSTRYLSAMKLCNAVVGNSSSGLLEAPSFHVPTVNVGDRQKGRERAESVLDCPPTAGDIIAATQQALSPSAARFAKHVRNPYEKHGTSRRIFEAIVEADLTVVKSFHDVSFQLNRE